MTAAFTDGTEMDRWHRAHDGADVSAGSVGALALGATRRRAARPAGSASILS
ncbi:hypothetical protein GA0070563_102102 [Micromonospora carbonacea]|uniref:Uncharacterized protein n=1 Tax=Micromonospora carbonacea TaxID=47853 RepID=A0A1C4V8P3_9ACTN|nr:hypothetical protein GA0070563_102102 [Micromonospora carbonacea]